MTEYFNETETNEAINILEGGAASGQPESNQASNALPSLNMETPITYKARNADRTEPLSTVIQRAQQGFDYAELMHQFKNDRAKFEDEQKQWKSILDTYKPYHEYAQQNPEWANHVKSQWENRLNSTSPTNDDLPPAVAKALSEIKEIKDQFNQSQQLARQAEEDARLNAAIEDVKKEYKDFDFSYTDPSTGESIERQVLKYAATNGINSFRAAFRDLFFDKIVDSKINSVKEDFAKKQQSQIKNGFLATSNESLLRSGGEKPDFKKLSYSQIIQRGFDELRR